MTPRLSIVIPVYNRALLVQRALSSCLAQGFSDWECIVVDDASTDATREAVQAIADPRIRLELHRTNAGQCAARNTGVQSARADWVVFLDSDDALEDGALEIVAERVAAAPATVGRLFFACRWDNGVISPDPPFDGTEQNYEGFVRWLELMRSRPLEAISVVRRSAFAEVPYPDRRTHEGGHNLDFMKRFNFIGYPDVVRRYHLDANNRLMDTTRDVKSLLDAAPGLSWLADTVLRDHGDALKRWAPSVYRDYLRTSGLYHLLAGNRQHGFGMTLRAWIDQPLDIRAAALLACAWLPPRSLARVKMRLNS